MRNRQGRVLMTVRTAQEFLDGHADVIGPTIAPSRRNLDAVEAELSIYADAQVAGGQKALGETSNQRAIRASLRNDHMRPIAEIARQKLRDVPQFSALVMPPTNATSVQLVSQANAMAEAALPYADVFKSVGLSDDFIAALKSTAAALAGSLTQRSDHTNRRSGATAGLAAKERQARSMLRLLDALVRPKLGTNDALLREWKAALHVARKPGVVTGASEGSTSPASGSMSGSTPASTTGQTTGQTTGSTTQSPTPPVSTASTAVAA